MSPRREARSGSTAVEFALVSPLLLLMIFGIIEFGRLLWVRNALQQTAIVTARCMGVRQAACATNGAVDVSKAVNFASNLARSYKVGVAASGVTASASASCSGQAGFATVTVATTFRSVVPRLVTALGNSRTVTGTACFPNQL